MRRACGGVSGLLVIGLLAAPSATQADYVELRAAKLSPGPGAGAKRSDRGREHPCRGESTQPSRDGAIDGTEGRDVLIGTDGPDVIIAKGGDDILCGLGHTDILAAGPGSDTIYGGDGGDADLSGAGGDDTVFGGGGGDDIYPGRGRDVVDGGGGEANVSFERSGGPVTVNLAKGWSKGQGTDQLSDVDGAWGTDRGDRLIGSSAANVLFGGRGADVLSGRGGKDVLLGAQGSDHTRGGSGRDRCVAERERACELGFPEIPNGLPADPFRAR